MDAVLETRAVTKRFGKVTANDEVDLHVAAGEVVGLLGHNGAGKTTLVKQVVGLLRPDEGAIRVAGVDAVRRPAAARRRVSLQAQTQAPVDGLTPRTAITLAARLRGLGPADASAAAEQLAEDLAIEPWLDRNASYEGVGLSGGIRRLTAFAMAVVAPVHLVVLDEPTNDVDPPRRRRLWGTVRRVADRGSGVLLVTHNVAEAEQAVDRLAVLDRGRVVASGTPEQLRGADRERLRLELVVPNGSMLDASGAPFSIDEAVEAGRRRLVSLQASDADRALRWATEQRTHGALESFSLTPTSLEDTYLALTDPEGPAPEELINDA